MFSSERSIYTLSIDIWFMVPISSINFSRNIMNYELHNTQKIAQIGRSRIGLSQLWWSFDNVAPQTCNMRPFFLTHSLIGLINGIILILTNLQVVRRGLSKITMRCYSFHPIYDSDVTDVTYKAQCFFCVCFASVSSSCLYLSWYSCV